MIFMLTTFLFRLFPARKQSAPLRRTDEAKELEKLFDPIFAKRINLARLSRKQKRRNRVYV
jgi:hypothetical protein